MVALARPPASHMVCRASRAPRACMAWTRVVISLGPLAPRGWPMARAQPGEHLGRGRRADALIPVDDPRRAVLAGHRDGPQFAREQPCSLGRSGALVAGGGELVKLGAAEVPLGRDELGADPLGNEAVGIAVRDAGSERVRARQDI